MMSRIGKLQPLEIHLATLSYEGECRWWSGDIPPFRFARSTFTNRANSNVSKDEFTTDGSGNVIYLARPVSMPCFGEIIPHLRFRNYTYGFNVNTRSPNKGRCLRCKSRDACGKIMAERIICIANGPDLMSKWKRSGDRIGRGYHGSKLLRAIIAHGPFQNVNDQMLADVRARRAAEERAEDAKRKARERKRGLNRGVVDSLFVRAAVAERDVRFHQLQQHALTSEERSWNRLSLASCEFIADVWLADWLLKWTKPHARPVDVCDWLSAHGRDQHQPRVSLQGRVPKDRKRIAFLEEGDPPVWEPFDPEAAIAAGRMAAEGSVIR